jgi:hypothetical protein
MMALEPGETMTIEIKRSASAMDGARAGGGSGQAKPGS